MKLTRSDPKAFAKLNLAIGELDGVEGRVGWFENAQYENGTPVAYVMMLNELGHGKTPPRPFMRPTASEKSNQWADIAAKVALDVLKGSRTAKEAMEAITIKAEDDIAQTIVSLTSPALSPITIELRAMKKRNPDLKITARTVGIAARRVKEPGYVTPEGVSTKPLNDTGHAIKTLTHIVEKA